MNASPVSIAFREILPDAAETVSGRVSPGIRSATPRPVLRRATRRIIKSVPDLLTSIAREWWADLIPDLRYGLRRLWKDPVATITTTLTIALAVGVTTATFGVIDAVLLRPLPFPHPERLVPRFCGSH